MNQIMPVGDGVLIAVERAVPVDTFVAFHAKWEEKFPDVPCFLVSEAQIVVRSDEVIMFEFTGEDISPAMVAEFQKWWEEVAK